MTGKMSATWENKADVTHEIPSIARFPNFQINALGRFLMCYTHRLPTALFSQPLKILDLRKS